jgi:hypothetical protein
MHGRGELTDQLRHDVRGTGVVDLTRSRRYMPATAVRKAQCADIDRRGSVDDRLADCKDGVLLFDAPEYMHRDPALGKQRVGHKPIACVDGLLVAEIKGDKVLVNAGAAQKLLTKPRLVLAVQVDALLDIR